MQKQKMTARMVVRAKAFLAMKDALLPGFCEDMVCDDACPFYINLPGNEPCSWIKTYQSIDRMEHVLQQNEQE
jgi:hypothetical protein